RSNLGGARMVAPDRLDPLEIFGRRNHHVPVPVARDARAAANRPLNAVRLLLAKRGNHSERGEQVGDPARDFPRRSREGDGAARRRSVPQEISPQKGEAKLLGDIEDQIRNPLGRRENPEETEDVLPDEGRGAIDEFQVARATRGLVVPRREPEDMFDRAVDLAGESLVAVSDGKPQAAAVRAGPLGKVEAQQGHQLRPNREKTANSLMAIVLGSELDIVALVEPIKVGRVEIREPDPGTDFVGAGSCVPGIPGSIQMTRHERNALHDRGNVGADRLQVALETGDRRTGGALLPGIEGYGLPDSGGGAHLRVRQATDLSQSRNLPADRFGDFDTRLRQFRGRGMLFPDAGLSPLLDAGTAQPDLRGCPGNGMERPEQVDTRRRLLFKAQAPRSDDKVAFREPIPSLERRLSFLEDEDAVAGGDSDRAAIGGSYLEEVFGKRMAQDALDGTEPNLVAVETEAKDLAEVLAGGLLVLAFAGHAGTLKGGVDEWTDLDHPDAAGVADEDVLLRVHAHDDDLVVADFFDVEVFADARTERGDQGADLGEAEHLVQARFFDVQDLAAEREDRLAPAVAALLGGAAGRVALDDEQLREGRVLFLAVGEFAGE